MIDDFLASGVLANVAKQTRVSQLRAVEVVRRSQGGEGENGERERAREKDKVRGREVGVSTSAVIRRAAQSLMQSSGGGQQC
jgi:hypothetical protein